MAVICVIGTGYVGLVTGTCLADLGNQVTCVDIVAEKIERLNQGIVPIYEPGLQALLNRNVHAGRLHFTTSYAEGLNKSDYVFIAVNTPPNGTQGGADMRYVEQAARMIAQELDHYAILINKSTVPVGSGDLVARLMHEHLARPSVPFSVVSNPEFLSEGSAVHDFQHPDRIVLGSADREAAGRVAQLYLPLRAPIVMTDLHTAELIKYASNAFLATRISFINEIARICERLGADIKEVAAGMGYDKRIGLSFLGAGLGYGGSCLPKDVRALAHMAEEADLHPQLLQAVMEINHDQRRLAVTRLTDFLGTLRGTVIGLLGLAFKANTDDMREAPSIDIVHWVTSQGAKVRVYDPVAQETAQIAFRQEGIRQDAVVFCESPYEVAAGADAIVVVTDWNELKALNMEEMRAAMRRPVLIDGRNIYDPDEMSHLGFNYRGIGRGSGPAQSVLLAGETQSMSDVTNLLQQPEESSEHRLLPASLGESRH